MTGIRTIFLLAALLAAGSLARPVAGQAADAYLVTDSVTVGDRFGLVVAVGHDGSRSAVFPDELLPDSLARPTAFALGDFEILDVRSRGRRPWESGGVIDSVIYETTTFAIDTARVAGIPVRLAGADTLSLEAGMVMIPVTSLVPPDAQDIRDLKPLAEFPRIWWPWVAGALALAAVAAALWWYRRQQSGAGNEESDAEPPVPPYEQAMQRLHELERIDVEHHENLKPYYVEISDVLRTYLGRRVRVKALESTTRELLASLENRSLEQGVPDSVIDEAREILDQADLVKFADVRPVWETNRRVMTLTKSTIETTERALREREEQLRRRSAGPTTAGTSDEHDHVSAPGRENAGDGARTDSTVTSGDGAPAGSAMKAPGKPARSAYVAGAGEQVDVPGPGRDAGDEPPDDSRSIDPFAPPESR